MSAAEQLSKDEIVAKFNQLREELTGIASKVQDLENDKSEHDSVLETLATTDGNRKCFRLIGGTLVERTVDEVKPGLVSTRDGIKTVISGLAEQYKAKEKELAEFQRKHNIQLKNPNQR